MPRKFAFYRIAGLVTAVVGIGLMVYLTLCSVQLYEEFYDWHFARPMQIAVDLSKPGEYTAPLHQTCSMAHNDLVMLEVHPGLGPCLKPEDAMDSLQAKLVIKTSDGAVVETVKIDSSTIRASWDNGPIELSGYAGLRRGVYTAHLQIESGVPELHGKQQLLYSRYQLCGMEQLPAYITGVFAALAGLVGVPTLIVIIPGLMRYGIWQRAPRNRPQIEITQPNTTPPTITANNTQTTNENATTA